MSITKRAAAEAVDADSVWENPDVLLFTMCVFVVVVTLGSRTIKNMG